MVRENAYQGVVSITLTLLHHLISLTSSLFHACSTHMCVYRCVLPGMCELIDIDIFDKPSFWKWERESVCFVCEKAISLNY